MTDFAPPRPPEPEDPLLARLDAELAAALANPSSPDTWADPAVVPPAHDAAPAGATSLPWLDPVGPHASGPHPPGEAPEPPWSIPAGPPVASVGVVAPAALLAAAAGGVGAEVRAAAKARTVVVACRTALGVAGPALPKASALARRLRSCGFEATACGATCHVVLGDVSDCGPLVVAAGDVPLVVAVAARDETTDALLATTGRLVLALPARTAAGLADLASESLSQVGPPVDRRRIPADPIGRRAAALGLRALANEEQA